jgi:diadenosine tetraphosphate (Ap4A) HIT family hydrolase
MKDCIFCKIVSDKMSCHKLYEDSDYLAFLSIHPNTDGVTVVIPKKHYSSYVFDMPDKELAKFTVIVKKVAKILDNYFEDVGRTALVFEGFGVDHVHAKLFPMHGTNSDKWEPILSGDEVNKYFDKYEGYISSHSGQVADDNQLKKLAQKIRMTIK